MLTDRLYFLLNYLGMELSVIEKRAQPRSQGFEHLQNIGLVEVIGEQIDSDGGVVKAFLEQVEDRLACVKTEPLVLRFKGLCVIIQCLGFLAKVLIRELGGICLGREVPAREPEIEVSRIRRDQF